jgi:hypothetical protein
MEMPGMRREQEEGPVAEAIERQTSRLPSDLFLWSGLGAVAISLGFFAAGRKETSLFVGMWVPTILLFGVYNKLVKVAGSDVRQRELH